MRERDKPDFEGAQDVGSANAPRGRREPTLGWTDDLDFAADRPAPRIARPRKPRWPWLLLAAAVALVLAGVVFRQPLADHIWPQTRAQALRAQAAHALAQGRLTADDGSGARELYEAALAIDPDRHEARAGLMRVALAALVQARTATAQNRFADAHAALQLARALSVPRADAVAVENDLRRREAAHAHIPLLLSHATAARAAGHLVDTGVEDTDAALPLYARVLALQPENEIALKGREDALADILQAARAQLREGDLAAATAAIAIARHYDAGHVDLPETEARLNEELDDVRRHAATDLAGGRLERAAGAYRLLAEAGNESEATAGFERVAGAYARRAQTLADDFRFADADAALAQARTLAPKLATLTAAERHLAHARRAHARIGERMAPDERARRVERLLADAAAAETRGDLLTPPGDSAFDKLRAARALAPDDPAVRRASARLLPAAKRCFEQELRNNNLARARACLDARVVAEGDGPALAPARRRLAQRWLDVGDERLGAGELHAAQAALDAARDLDPATPGLDDFTQRVRAATGALN